MKISSNVYEAAAKLNSFRLHENYPILERDENVFKSKPEFLSDFTNSRVMLLVRKESSKIKLKLFLYNLSTGNFVQANAMCANTIHSKKIYYASYRQN